MIVDNFDVKCIGLAPAETDPPLIVNPNAVLPPPIAFQGFQPIPRRRSERAQLHRAVQLAQLPAGNLLKRGKTRNTLAPMNSFGVATAKRPNHPMRIQRMTLNVNRSIDQVLPRRKRIKSPENLNQREVRRYFFLAGLTLVYLYSMKGIQALPSAEISIVSV